MAATEPERVPKRTWRTPRRLVAAAAIVVVLGYGLVVVAAAAIVPFMLYPTPKTFPADVPADATLVEATASDGARVRGLLFEGPPNAAVVVFFHGNGETVGHDVWIARDLRRRDLGVLLVEYRGYGLSRAEPSPSEAGFYADAEAMLALLEKRGVGKDRVLLWGQSLGTGVAAEMALRGRGRALVLVSPYTSIVDVARRMPTALLPVSLVVRDKFDTRSKAPKITVPTLIVHGDADEVIAYDMGRELSHLFPHATLQTQVGRHHGDLVVLDSGGVFDPWWAAVK
jgi:pimeloyl-ACP methyl ester carboxylesterase